MISNQIAHQQEHVIYNQNTTMRTEKISPKPHTLNAINMANETQNFSQ